MTTTKGGGFNIYNKPFIIEVNGCPGLSGIEAITGENVAGAIIQYVLDNYKRNGLRKTTDTNGATATAQPIKNILDSPLLNKFKNVKAVLSKNPSNSF
jgi:hypothetical protein